MGPTEESRRPFLETEYDEKKEVPSLHRVQLTPQMKLELERDSGRDDASLRAGILVWLTLQNSVHTLLIRYSRAREVEKMFLSSAAVFFTEILKVVVCLGMIIFEEKGLLQMFSQVKRQVLDNPWDTLKVCVPAMIYTVQNNLFYVAASHLEAATFMVTSQLKIFTTAIFTVIMLGRRLSRVQWVALATLFVGVSLVQLQQSGDSSRKRGPSNQRPFIGFLAVFMASILSGFAGIYFESILKGSAPVSLWMRNVQMSVFAIPSSLLASFIQVIASVAISATSLIAYPLRNEYYVGTTASVNVTPNGETFYVSNENGVIAHGRNMSVVQVSLDPGENIFEILVIDAQGQPQTINVTIYGLCPVLQMTAAYIAFEEPGEQLRQPWLGPQVTLEKGTAMTVSVSMVYDSTVPGCYAGEWIQGSSHEGFERGGQPCPKFTMETDDLYKSFGNLDGTIFETKRTVPGCIRKSSAYYSEYYYIFNIEFFTSFPEQKHIELLKTNMVLQI